MGGVADGALSYQSQRWAGVPRETACSPLSVASPKLVRSVLARSAAWAMHEGESDYMHAGICGAQESVGRDVLSTLALRR
jgi:hypothetical protein